METILNAMEKGENSVKISCYQSLIAFFQQYKCGFWPYSPVVNAQ